MNGRGGAPLRSLGAESRFFTAEAGQVPEPAFWNAIERLAALGVRAQSTAEVVRWRLPARRGPVVAWLERELAGGAAMSGAPHPHIPALLRESITPQEREAASPAAFSPATERLPARRAPDGGAVPSPWPGEAAGQGAARGPGAPRGGPGRRVPVVLHVAS
jgi:hypothetical protein